MEKPIVIGAVIYDPKVTVIWKIIGDFFASKGCPLELVYYSTYELQVDGLVRGHLDVAWNSPLAWIDAQRRTGGKCRAVAMRDTDQGRVSHFVARRASGPATLADIRGKTVAFGAKDSPQATLIPIEQLSRAGLAAGKDFEVRRFDVKVGLHGDHVGGERDAFECLAKGDAAASVMLDLNWEAWTRDGTVNGDEYRIVGSTGRFDHCNFTVREDFAAARERRFCDALFSMTYSNPAHREMMDLEGLKAWEPGRTSGYELLSAAVDRQRFFGGGPS
jgi:ABC-type phosphate/phosphonate transport system substrate-binding protein